MVLDSSALVAILFEETGYQSLVEKAGKADRVFLGAPTALETALLLSRKFGRDPRPQIAAILRSMRAEIVEFGPEHYEIAISAFLRFGKGHHPAALNFGDCMSYALAAISGQPLLYAGDDFSRTDIQGA